MPWYRLEVGSSFGIGSLKLKLGTEVLCYVLHRLCTNTNMSGAMSDVQSLVETTHFIHYFAGTEFLKSTGRLRSVNFLQMKISTVTLHSVYIYT